ncbi:hypothetical protein AAF712_009201 [Marasmius tenuissimus]|uniref:F-box domain-containing protein n=1 Tax=Marasmius tenuissimus TaxID=585030 RepID=A0ABR2ZRA0_9AGAR
MITKSEIDSIDDFVIPEPRDELSELGIWTQLRSLQPSLMSDTLSLHNYLSRVNLEIGSLSQLIQALENRVLEAQSKRDKLQWRASQILSLLSPIRRLPSELLMKIFECATGAAWMGGNMLGANSEWNSQAFRISSVCYQWRAIALDTPELWSRFAFDFKSRAQRPLDLFLMRSKQRPLSFTITHIDHHISPDLSPLRSLVAYSSRWSSVDYYCPRAQPVQTLLNKVEELSSLQHAVCPAQGVAPVTLSKQLQNCSTLRTLVVRYDEHSRANIPSLPLSSIRRLIFEYKPKKAFGHSLEVLRTCAQHIEELAYELIRDEKDHNLVNQAGHAPLDETQEPIECRHVWKLAIDLYHRNGIYPHLVDLFRSLTLPSLVYLKLAGDCNTNLPFEGTWPRELFDGFVVRSKCTSLTTLHLRLPLSGKEVIASLRHFSSLEVLSIAEVFTGEEGVLERNKLVKTVTKPLMRHLTVVRNSAHSAVPLPLSLPVLPKLRSLSLSVHAHFDADVEFVRMVQSRWYPFCSGLGDPSLAHCRLRAMFLNIQDRDVERSVYESLKGYDSKGMRVTVKANGAYIV